MNNLIKGKQFEWETIIGLEIHAKVKSNTKLFSSSSTIEILKLFIRLLNDLNSKN